MANRVVLKPGREKPLRRRHPWVFDGAIAHVDGKPQSGETVDVVSADGQWLGRGAWSPFSQIRVRVWTFCRDEEIDKGFFSRRVCAAVKLRECLVWYPGSACRLINAESDGLPGIIADKYGSFVVCQFLSAGAERWRDVVIGALAGLPDCQGIYERSDADVRRKEGLEPRTGVVYGNAPPPRIEIEEHGVRYLVDVYHGHKTGFYLDQRENRRIVAAKAQGREVLNCFAYTGAFGVAALRDGAARVTNVDTSAACLALAAEHIRLNGLEPGRVEHVQDDAFDVLRRWRAESRRFDMIVLDPPRFVESQGQLVRGCRGYKDINMLAFHLLRPGGLLATFSCSGLVPPELFQKVVADAALDAGREARIVARLSQASDHPVALHFPEGAYLKGLVCQVV